MELTISQRKFSADGATKGKEIMAIMSECSITRMDKHFFSRVEFPLLP